MKTFLLTLYLFLVSLPLLAQEPALLGNPAPAGPKTLAEALAQVNWDPSRGVLLTVNPQGVSVPSSALNANSPFIPELTTRGYDSRALADYFGRLMVREGSVTVLAPQTMTVLNTHPGPPNLYVGLRRNDLMELLIDTLTPAQWKQIGSESGLGRDDMTPDQQMMFEDLLPNPFVVAIRQPHQSGEQTKSLTAAERGNVRLCVTMATTVYAKTVQSAASIPIVIDRNADQGEKPYLKISAAAEDQPRLMYNHGRLFTDTPMPYGVKVSDTVPNRLKQGQLDLKSPTFDSVISLDLVAGKLTVGDLIARVGTATHLELYADRRLAQLPVWVKGQSARSADVLNALCLSICGTFRQVGPAYLLTDDVLGVGTRRALLDNWDADAQALLAQKQQEALQHAAKVHAAQYLTWSDDEPLKLNADMRAQIRTQDQAKNWDGLSVPLTALTRDQQQFIQNAATALGKEDNGQHAVTTDQVSLRVDTSLVFVVPGIGQIVDTLLPSLNDLEPETPPADIPLPPIRSILVQPADLREAVRAIQEAKKRGFASLWVQVPYNNDTKPLMAALHAGQKVHLPVWAVVRLLSRPPGTFDTEINILGQPESVYTANRPASVTAPVEWARLDTPGLASVLRAQLLALVKLPGLAGLVLRDTAGPGFDLPLPLTPCRFGRREGYGSDVGYTLPDRLAFLRRNGADPVDIVPYLLYTRSALNLSEFPDASKDDPLAKEWLDRRYTQTQHLLTGVYQSLRTAHPSLPLMIQGHLSVLDDPDSWYGSWDKADALPYINTDFLDAETSMAQDAHTFSRRAVLTIPLPSPVAAPADYAASIQTALRRDGKGWDGMVLDLSEVPLSKALLLLDGLPVTVPPKPIALEKTP